MFNLFESLVLAVITLIMFIYLWFDNTESSPPNIWGKVNKVLHLLSISLVSSVFIMILAYTITYLINY